MIGLPTYIHALRVAYMIVQSYQYIQVKEKGYLVNLMVQTRGNYDVSDDVDNEMMTKVILTILKLRHDLAGGMTQVEA